MASEKASAKKRERPSIIKVDDEERTTEEIELFKKKLIEDDRMDSVFRMGQNLTEKFDNRAYLHPHGMTDFDYKSMPEHRRTEFEKFKHKTRHENYQYLGDHPEIDGLLALFFKKLLHVQPPDPVHFAAEYFTRDTAVINYADLLTDEREKLAHYRINKMKNAEKITTIPVYEVKQKKEEEVVTCHKVVKTCEKPSSAADKNAIDYESPEALLNWLKKLNIGPLARDFDIRGKPQAVIEIKPPPKKTKKKAYCGCKDPGRREKAHPSKKVTPSVALVSEPSPAPIPEETPADPNETESEVVAELVETELEDEPHETEDLEAEPLSPADFEDGGGSDTDFDDDDDDYDDGDEQDAEDEHEDDEIIQSEP